MKRMIRDIDHMYDIFGMANLNPQKSGLSVIIWSDHSGITRKVSHRDTPRIKVGTHEHWVSVTIEPNPVIKERSKKIPDNIMPKIQEGIDYVGRNYDVFLKHYLDTDFSFDDEALFEELRKRGEYK